MPKRHVDAALAEGVVEFADLVLRLGDGHAVSGNDDDFVGSRENCRRFFGRGAAHGTRFLRACSRRLHLSEGSEQNVGERAVHGLRHVHRENEARRAVERSRHDEQLAVEHESHGRGRESGVGVQQRDHRRHVGAADGDDHQHAENQRDDHHRRIEVHVVGMQHQHHRDSDSDRQEAQVDDVLSFIGDGALRQDLHQLARRHQAAGDGERAQDDLERQHAHHEFRDVGRAQVELGRADQRDAERAESVAEGGPLRHGGHGDAAQRDSDDGAEHESDGDPLVIDDALVEERANDGQQHARFAREDATARGGRRTQPLERQDEQRRRNDVEDLDDVFTTDEAGHGLGALLTLNILSMRSVMMKPPTMLLVAATMAMVPSIVAKRLLPFARENDRAHHGDSVERVGERHERRVEKRGDPPDHLESDERGEHEDIQTGNQVSLQIKTSYDEFTTEARRTRRISIHFSCFYFRFSVISVSPW